MNLRELASAATPGPWRVDHSVDAPDFENRRWVVTDKKDEVVGLDLLQDDAVYIAAASPDRILALLDRIEALEMALGRVLAHYERFTLYGAQEREVVEQAHATLARGEIGVEPPSEGPE